ncbi:uncharacterized protein LOC105433045 [Pogonomyrmex barbatus]|uniref:Uncharacterized protein LOC105433045 n=1 Tax=Pogonomyrmex barbatus TaxID=144034 RepID=A0A6I9WT84_9HYME|nr:uncharacterized protein LOC105433045 [Pogonomyrmex barbatus]
MRRLLAFYGRAVSRGSSTRGFLGREFSTASKSLHPASTIAHVYAASQSEILDESSMGDDCVICRSKRNETKGKPACRFLLPLWFLGISFAVTTERIRISGRMRQRVQCLQIDATPENLVEFHFMRPQNFTLTLEGPQKSNADIVKNIASKKNIIHASSGCSRV